MDMKLLSTQIGNGVTVKGKRAVLLSQITSGYDKESDNSHKGPNMAHSGDVSGSVPTLGEGALAALTLLVKCEDRRAMPIWRESRSRSSPSGM